MLESDSSAVPTENHGAAVTTVDGNKKGDFDRLNCDFRAFPDKKGEKSNGTPEAIVISNREKLAEYLAAQEKYGILSEELKSELSDKDDEYFKNNTVVIITADCEYDLGGLHYGLKQYAHRLAQKVGERTENRMPYDFDRV